MNDLIEEIRDEVIEWRRHLHRHPELSSEEEETSRFVYEMLESFGGIELSKPTGTSVLARLVGEEPGRTIAIRADVDALPVVEETGLGFASQNEGVMHACGQDGHAAIPLGAAKILSGIKEEVRGEVRFVFQHAEEKRPSRAQELVKAGIMEGVDTAVGLHLAAFLGGGKVRVRYGAALPASDTFEIVVEGEGRHAAWPHQSAGSDAVAAQIVTHLQHVFVTLLVVLDPLGLTLGGREAATRETVWGGRYLVSLRARGTGVAGRSGDRSSGVLLAALAVQFVLDGIERRLTF